MSGHSLKAATALFDKPCPFGVFGLNTSLQVTPVHAQRIIASQFRLTVAAARSTAFPCPLRSPYGISNPNYPSYVFISVLKAALTNTIHSKTNKIPSNYPFWVSLPKYLFQYHVLKTAVRFEIPIALPAAHHRFFEKFSGKIDEIIG